MKQIYKYGFGCLILLAAAMLMASCDDEDTSELRQAVYPDAVKMTLSDELQQLVYTDESGASVLPLLKGLSATLGYSISPENVTFDEVNWTSSDESVATVEQNGTVNALSGDGRGYSIIQVAPSVFYSGSGIYGTLKVVVVNEIIPAELITIQSSADAVYAGETLQLSASILPITATYRTVRWSSSDESVATVDNKGLVTGKVNDAVQAFVTITASSIDGAQVIARKQIAINQIVKPEDIEIEQNYSVDNGYLCAITEKSLKLDYTTTPQNSTTSLITWETSNEQIATVAGGVVTFNQNGIFGDVTITATCPDNGNSASITLRLEEGLIRELYHDENNYNWYDAKQSGSGTSTSHEWSYGKLTVKTYKQNDTNQRADFKCWSSKTWLHAGNYPIFAIRMDDVKDLYPGVTGRNITLDASGTCAGSSYKGGLDGNNNKWLYDYKCSDGSHVFIYNLSTQKWATGGALPTNAAATFTAMQFKYADMKPLTEQVTYNVYWVQTFKTVTDLQKYIESEGLTYEVIK